MVRLNNLVSPGRIGSMELRNRMIMTAMGTELGGEEGFLTERQMQYYEERAKGGVGMIILGTVSVGYPQGVCTVNQLALSDDKYIPGLKEFADRIHKHGAKITPQLQHPGLVSAMDTVRGMPLLTPSIPEGEYSSNIGTMGDITPTEMSTLTAHLTLTPTFKVATEEDIQAVVEMFAKAAERAKMAGCDAVEIHAAHGYLIDSFLNPTYNKRTDKYGGSLENRARLLVEVIQACKRRTGQDFPLVVKLNAITLHEAGGITVEDAIATAKMAEAAGADAIFATAYGGSAMATACQDSHTPQKANHLIAYTRQIKEAIRIPVIGVGRIVPSDADKLISDGALDFVAMGRQLLADPELPNKVHEDRLEDIRPCIVCFSCISQIFLGQSVKCAINPRTGHEGEIEIKEADKKKRVLVVGGGPAGMEAARVATLRGHHVILCEKEKFLGGTLFFASVMYPTNYDLAEFLERQIRKLKVDFRLGVEVTLDYVKDLKPDVVITAVGVKRFLPDIPGVKQSHVLDGDDMRNMITGSGDGAAGKVSKTTKLMMFAGSVTGITRDPKKIAAGSKMFMPLGNNIVIIGGGLVAVEIAEFLAERGRNVTIIEEGQNFGWEMSLLRRWWHLSHNVKLGVKSLAGCTATKIGDKTVTYVDGDGQEQTVAADNVIVAKGHMHNLGLAEVLEKEGFKVVTAGDCSSDDLISGAMRDGFMVGQAI